MTSDKKGLTPGQALGRLLDVGRTLADSTRTGDSDLAIRLDSVWLALCHSEEDRKSLNQHWARGVEQYSQLKKEAEALLDRVKKLQAERDVHNNALINLCDKHLDDIEPSPGCHVCALEELRDRLVLEHDGSPARVDAELWEQRANEKEMDVEAERGKKEKFREAFLKEHALNAKVYSYAHAVEVEREAFQDSIKTAGQHLQDGSMGRAPLGSSVGMAIQILNAALSRPSLISPAPTRLEEGQ